MRFPPMLAMMIRASSRPSPTVRMASSSSSAEPAAELSLAGRLEKLLQQCGANLDLWGGERPR